MILKNIKISNIRVTLNSEAEVSYIILKIAIQLSLLIIKS